MKQLGYTRTIGVLLMVFLIGVGTTNADMAELSELPPGEQYRQLSLILLISGGADPAMVDILAPGGDGQGGQARLGPDDYKTPLIRIVDQQTMLTGAMFLLKFAQQSKQEIESRLVQINADNPILVSMVDINAITEDAIIIRNAIADSIGYSDKADDPVVSRLLQDYRVQTIKIRNIMEFDLYHAELERLTDEAIASVGGKLDAYKRMFDEEVDSKGLDRQFDAAQYIFNRSEKFDEEAGIMTEQIMKNVILSQSKPIP